MSASLNTELGTTDVVWNLDSLYDSLQDELLQDDLDLCIQEAELLREGCAGKLAKLEPAVFVRSVRRLERIAPHRHVLRAVLLDLDAGAAFRV